MDLHLDLLGGLAGDMFVAAMLDLAPHLQKGVEENLRRVGPLLDGVACRCEAFNDGVFIGRRFIVERTARSSAQNDHGHINWSTLRERLAASALDPAVKTEAIAIFALLADAEGKVHGLAPEDVHFHEIGAWDSIADIVSAAYAIVELGVAGCSVGPIPLGSGVAETQHGVMPIPAPATVVLLEGLEVVRDGPAGERVTPTGAAILRRLISGSAGAGIRRLAGAGVGFGARRLPGVSNCVRALRLEPGRQQIWEEQTLCIIEFEVDDQSPEDLSVALDHIRARPGVLDVVQATVLGKKNRLASSVRVLLEPAREEDIASVCFEETTTIGLRSRRETRKALTRRQFALEREGQRVRVKRVERPGGASAKTEIDDVADATSHERREALRRDAAESRDWEDP